MSKMSGGQIQIIVEWHEVRRLEIQSNSVNCTTWAYVGKSRQSVVLGYWENVFACQMTGTNYQRYISNLIVFKKIICELYLIIVLLSANLSSLCLKKFKSIQISSKKEKKKQRIWPKQ